eukprot:NODE_3334_length_2051_cov_5.047817.p1 GENE.NODE_3334_length_2051_cov_5.047817~~NODE_3334_length_2051_cov_5.047817.p1  ORF type:complete len:344 (-),score=56.79 NODE_3334_length_2051_cov_5.047817:130-1161(-)
MRSKRNRGYVLLASAPSCRAERSLGDMLPSGLVAGYGYPVVSLELVDGEMLVEVANPWPSGLWLGRWGERSAEWASASPETRELLSASATNRRAFWMNIQDFCRHFADITEARTVGPQWYSAAVTCSPDRPSYPLISVSSVTQGIFVLSQGERRWSHEERTLGEEHLLQPPSAGDDKPIGLRLYRCRVVAPPRNTVGVRQNVSSPFRNLELLAIKPPTKAHSVFVEVARLEPNCLYIVAVDLEYRCMWALLQVFTGSAPRFRELSPPESSYFLQAQPDAGCAERDSFSSQGSIDNLNLLGSLRGADPNFSETRAAEGWRVGGEGKVSRVLQAFVASCTSPFQC